MKNTYKKSLSYPKARTETTTLLNPVRFTANVESEVATLSSASTAEQFAHPSTSRAPAEFVDPCEHVI